MRDRSLIKEFVMAQSLSRLLGLLVLSVFLVAPAYAGDEKDKSPEDVFKAFTAAMKKEDVKAAMSHLTRDSQSIVAGYMCYLALLEKALTGPFLEDRSLTPKEKEHIDAIEKVLNRHGLSEDALRKILKTFEKDDKKTTTDEEKSVAVGELVKDKPAFVTEVLKASTARLEDRSFKDFFKEIGETKVKEVKIDGQQAKGEVTFPSAEAKAGHAKRLPPELVRGPSVKTASYYFKLESGVWKIDLIETARNWPQPPAPPAQPAQVQPRAQPQPPPSYSRPGPVRRLLNRLFDW
jgi:hypothetical protein